MTTTPAAPAGSDSRPKEIRPSANAAAKTPSASAVVTAAPASAWRRSRRLSTCHAAR